MRERDFSTTLEVTERMNAENDPQMAQMSQMDGEKRTTDGHGSTRMSAEDGTQMAQMGMMNADRRKDDRSTSY